MPIEMTEVSIAKGPVFVPLQDVRQGLPMPDGRPPLYGTKEILFKDEAEGAKSVRKMTATLRSFQDAQILPATTSIGPAALLHGDKGDPTFIEVKTDNSDFFVSARAFSTTPLSTDGLNVSRDADLSLFQKQPSELVSGVCLFGANAAEGTTASGRIMSLIDARSIADEQDPIVDITTTKLLHPSEAETILRITQFADSIFGKDGPKINYHVPRIEYYVYGLDLFARGQMNRELLNRWFAEVDTRTAAVVQMLGKRTTMEAEIVEPMKNAEEYVKNAEDPNVSELAEILSQDPLWENLLAQKPPTNFLDINYLSFTHPYLNVARKTGSVIAIENPDEARIYTETLRTAHLIPREALVGVMYVHPKLLTQHGKGKECLYFQPNHDGRGLDSLGEIVYTYKKENHGSNTS